MVGLMGLDEQQEKRTQCNAIPNRKATPNLDNTIQLRSNGSAVQCKMQCGDYINSPSYKTSILRYFPLGIEFFAFYFFERFRSGTVRFYSILFGSKEFEEDLFSVVAMEWP